MKESELKEFMELATQSVGEVLAYFKQYGKFEVEIGERFVAIGTALQGCLDLYTILSDRVAELEKRVAELEVK